MLVLIGSAFSTAEKHDGVLRARGLNIENDQGKERILIGSPIPGAENRVRTDLTHVRELRGKRFPEQYMEWYRSYQNDMNSILILDANGFDRVGLGDLLIEAERAYRHVFLCTLRLAPIR